MSNANDLSIEPISEALAFKPKFKILSMHHSLAVCNLDMEPIVEALLPMSF